MSQQALFPGDTECLELDLPGGHLRYWPQLIPLSDADLLLERLQKQVPWEQSEISIAGRRLKIPRLNAWYGEPGADYSYSGRLFRALPWLPELQRLKQCVEQVTGVGYNSALLNLYRDGRDSVDWHSDDEPELGVNPVIASVSLGAERRFQIKHKTRRDMQLQPLELAHGSLLLMEREFQHHWKHRLPKMSGLEAARVNITFRKVARGN